MIFQEKFQKRFIENLPYEKRRELFDYLKRKSDLVKIKCDGREKKNWSTLIPGHYCTYMHIAPNGLIYIGETKDDRKIKHEYPGRWGTNGQGYQQNHKMVAQLMKYPWDEWEHLFIARGIDEVVANDLERYFIEFFGSYHNGPNLNEGGKGKPLGKKGRPPRINPILVVWDSGAYRVFPTQKEAAYATGKQASNVSDYVNGKKPQNNIGMKFYKIETSPFQ